MTDLRLSGGEYRGRRLRVPAGVRPTEGRLREALFSIWQEDVVGARVLDLFAGAGAVGLESLGRGARMAVLVEGDPRTARTLRENAETLDVGSAARIYRFRLPAGLAVLREREEPFDLVFVDPPYGFEGADRLLAGIAPLLAPGGSVAFEHGLRDSAPQADGLEMTESRRYGGSCLSFYRGAGAATG